LTWPTDENYTDITVPTGDACPFIPECPSLERYLISHHQETEKSYEKTVGAGFPGAWGFFKKKEIIINQKILSRSTGESSVQYIHHFSWHLNIAI
ncbi:hypothetical protein Chor_000876, partial [Crotalus horridus]